jgi:hypothetical protein
VLRIRDVHPGSGSASKNLSILTQKVVSKPSEIWSGVFIPDPDLDFLPIPAPGSRGQKAPDSGTAKLVITDTLSEVSSTLSLTRYVPNCGDARSEKETLPNPTNEYDIRGSINQNFWWHGKSDVELIVWEQFEKKQKKQGKGVSNSENSADFLLLQRIVMCPKNIKTMYGIEHCALEENLKN